MLLADVSSVVEMKVWSISCWGNHTEVNHTPANSLYLSFFVLNLSPLGKNKSINLNRGVYKRAAPEMLWKSGK